MLWSIQTSLPMGNDHPPNNLPERMRGNILSLYYGNWPISLPYKMLEKLEKAAILRAYLRHGGIAWAMPIELYASTAFGAI